MQLARYLLAVGLVLSACSDDPSTTGNVSSPDAGVDSGVDAADMQVDSLQVPDGCNPVGAPVDCLLPFPSDVFVVDGQLEVPDVALPTATPMTGDQPLDFQILQPTNGASVYPPIMALFEQPIDQSSLTFHTGDIGRSIAADHSTIILDAESGAFVGHFAELDLRAPEENRALMIRPMTALEYGRRYIVAIQSLQSISGEPIAPNEGFRRLRDGESAPASVEALRQRYETEVFAPLEAAGVERSGLQLAWDFTVRTEEDAIGDMLRVRELTIAALENNPPQVTVVSVEDDVNEWIGRRVEFTLTVPLFMESAEPGALLHRGADGRVEQNGTAEVPGVAVVPVSVVDGSATLPAHAVQFGHGFFGGRSEISRGPAKEFAESYPSVIFGVDWWGMSAPDRDVVLADLLNDPKSTLRFAERGHQGMANQIALTRAISTSLRDVPELQANAEAFWGTNTASFWGISQGHILGGTYVAIAPEISKAALEVGGAAFTFIMFRAGPFAPFLIFIQQVLAGPLDQQKFGALAQTSFDRIDPIAYAHLVRRAPLEGGPTDRQIFMAAGLGDPAVPNLATYLHARAIGIPVLEGSAYEPWGLTSATLPAPSGLVVHDFGVEAPLPGTYADGVVQMNEVHGGVRESAAHQAQLDAFFSQSGQIPTACDGVCDPE